MIYCFLDVVDLDLEALRVYAYQKFFFSIYDSVIVQNRGIYSAVAVSASRCFSQQPSAKNTLSARRY